MTPPTTPCVLRESVREAAETRQKRLQRPNKINKFNGEFSHPPSTSDKQPTHTQKKNRSQLFHRSYSNKHTYQVLQLERDREYRREVAQISPHVQADPSAHRGSPPGRLKKPPGEAPGGKFWRIRALQCLGGFGHCKCLGGFRQGRCPEGFG